MQDASKLLVFLEDETLLKVNLKEKKCHRWTNDRQTNVFTLMVQFNHTCIRATFPFLSKIFLSLHFKSEKGRDDVWNDVKISCIKCLLLSRRHGICAVKMKNKIKFLPLIDFLLSKCFGVWWCFKTSLVLPIAQLISTIQHKRWNFFSWPTASLKMILWPYKKLMKWGQCLSVLKMHSWKLMIWVNSVVS